MSVENSERPAHTLWRALWRLVHHRWHDAFGRSAIPAPALQRLGAQVAANELQHTGQIRIVAEAGLACYRPGWAFTCIVADTGLA